MQPLFINQRIQLVPPPHLRGTIRYIGPVPGQPSNQQWIGVEWDDETKGKHNGSVTVKSSSSPSSNVQLFTTFQNRNSASFVKYDKLLQTITVQPQSQSQSQPKQQPTNATSFTSSADVESCENEEELNQVTIYEAIRVRYINAPVEKLIELTLGKNVKVQIVGADKIASKMSQVGLLEKMGLPNCRIHSVDRIGELCPSM